MFLLTGQYDRPSLRLPVCTHARQAQLDTVCIHTHTHTNRNTRREGHKAETFSNNGLWEFLLNRFPRFSVLVC